MRNASALAVLALSFASAAAPLQTPCDVLPPNVGPALCQPCPGGPPVPAGRVAGAGLDYVDQWHSQCEIYRANRGIDQCKRDTVCAPGWERFQDGGVWKCRQPASGKMRDDCEKGLPLTISQVQNDQGLADPTVYPGHAFLFVKGSGAANATSAEMTGGINVTLGEAARRLGNNAVCLPPDCQVAKLEIPPAAVGVRQKLTLYTPHRYRSASSTLFVSVPPTPATPLGGRGLQQTGGVGPAVSSNLSPSPTRTPTPRPATQQQYSAGLSCPGTLSQFQNVATPDFEIRSAQVQATVTAHWLNSKNPDGSPKCTMSADFQYQIVIKSLTQGHSDVTVSWQPQPANNFANPIDYSSVQTISLPQGRWRIAPDATFPSDFSYTISFRD